MNLLVLGGGGREHAIVWKLKQSSLVKKIYVAPGNPGIGSLAELVNIPVEDQSGLLHFALKSRVDLTVVGPEIPLVDGVVDFFQQSGLKIFGPTRQAAALEGNKVFAKEFMRKYKIPTAGFKVFTDYSLACQTIKEQTIPVVIKASGLAAGKGVRVCLSVEEGLQTLKSMMLDKKFGDAGKQVVIEEFMRGEEATLLCLCDGKTVLPLSPSQDHKRVFDQDQGPNTGGMGAYSSEKIKSNSSEHCLSNAEGVAAGGVFLPGCSLYWFNDYSRRSPCS